MKFNYKDLDPQIVNTLKQFDELKFKYNKDKGSLVAFDGNQFYTTNIERKEKVNITSNELKDLLANLYSDNDKYTNSYNNSFNSNYFSYNFPLLLNSVDGRIVHKNTSDIKVIKSDEIYYYILNENGEIIIIDKSDISTQKIVSIFNIIKNYFPLDGFRTTDIIGFINYDNGYLISTNEYGVFYINIEKGIYELKFNDNHVIEMIELPNAEIMLIKEDVRYAVVIYDLISGERVEQNNSVSKNSVQIPYKVAHNNNYIFVLGRNIVNGLNNNILHCWIKDKTDSFVNIDEKFIKYKESPDYVVKFLEILNNKLYVSGIYNKKIFTWIYDLSTLKVIEETYFDKFEVLYDDYKCLSIIYDEVLYIINDRVFVNDRQYKLNKSSNNIIIRNNRILSVGKDNLIEYITPKYNNHDFMEFSFNISKNSELLLLCKTKADIKIKLFNKNTLEEFEPNIYIISQKDNAHILKYKNVKHTNIGLTIELNKEDVIEGLVINNNIYWGDF